MILKKKLFLYRWFKSNLDKSYKVVSSKCKHFVYQSRGHLRNLDSRTENSPKNRTALYRWLKPNLDKSYEFTSTKN